jgi:hypothetical protein
LIRWETRKGQKNFYLSLYEAPFVGSFSFPPSLLSISPLFPLNHLRLPSHYP